MGTPELRTRNVNNAEPGNNNRRIKPRPRKPAWSVIRRDINNYIKYGARRCRSSRYARQKRRQARPTVPVANCQRVITSRCHSWLASQRQGASQNTVGWHQTLQVTDNSAVIWSPLHWHIRVPAVKSSRHASPRRQRHTPPRHATCLPRHAQTPPPLTVLSPQFLLSIIFHYWLSPILLSFRATVHR